MGKKNKAKQILGPDGKHILCYLCGERPAEDWDHVPLQNLFPNNAQFKGFKLPSCKKCNGGFARDDEYFRDVLTMAASNPDALEVLQKTMRSITRPREQLQLKTKAEGIMEHAFPVPMFSPSGLRLPTKLAFKFDAERTSRVIARIVRGLYYQLFQAPLAKECVISGALARARDANQIIEDLKRLSGNPTHVHKPDSTFSFAMWGMPEDRYMTSIWVLRFYDELYAHVGVRGPFDLAMAAETSQDDLQGQGNGGAE